MAESARVRVVEYFHPTETNPTKIRFRPGGGSSGGGDGLGERVAGLEASMSLMNDALKGVQSDVREIRDDVKELPFKMVGAVAGGFTICGVIATLVFYFLGPT